MSPYYKDEATTADYIVAFLLSGRSTRVMNQVLWERVQKRRQTTNRAAFNQAIYRLKKKGIIGSDDTGITLLRSDRIRNSALPFIKTKPSKTNQVLIIFDIPEKDRRFRDWLRGQIRLWDFTMIQRSVWLGSGPLPEEFYKRIKYLKMEKHIRVFVVRKKTENNQ